MDKPIKEISIWFLIIFNILLSVYPIFLQKFLIMRQWMVDPRLMCRKHLLGEHAEHHMLIGSLKRKKSISGFIRNNLLEPKSIEKRHNELVKEMNRRGYNHKTELNNINLEELIAYLPLKEQNYIIDSNKSQTELFRRCPKCSKRNKL